MPEQRQIPAWASAQSDADPWALCQSNDDQQRGCRHFHGRPELHAIAIVEDERPVGIINRQQVHGPLRHPVFPGNFWQETMHHVRQPFTRLIERDHDIDELIGILTSQDQRYLSDGFIVTENGRYIGLGTGDNWCVP